MALTSYEFGKLCDSNRLTQEINESAIIIALSHITTQDQPATTVVWFKDELSGGDETILNGLVNDHVNTPLEQAEVLYYNKTKKLTVATYVKEYVFESGIRSVVIENTGALPVEIYFDNSPRSDAIHIKAGARSPVISVAGNQTKLKYVATLPSELQLLMTGV